MSSRPFKTGCWNGICGLEIYGATLLFQLKGRDWDCDILKGRRRVQAEVQVRKNGSLNWE